MKKIYPYVIGFVVLSWALLACKKDEVTISPEEKMLTTHTWMVAEVCVNDSIYHNAPKELIGAKIKFNSTSPTGTISFQGTSYPNSFWMFESGSKTRLIINPYTQTQVTANISKLESAKLWLKFQATVPFLGVELAPSTELRMVPAQ